MILDVLCTALRRPELFRLTCKTFLGGRINGLPNTRMVLNIDPLGAGSVDEMVAIAEEYAQTVVVRVADDPCFASAINWCISNLESQYVLHMEDDWILTKSIDYRDLHNRLDSSEELQIGFGYRRARLTPARFSFRPSLVKRSAYDTVSVVPAGENPEKWFAETLGPGVSSDCCSAPALEDTGRKWAKGSGLQRSNGFGQWFMPRKTSIVSQLDWKLSYLKYRALAGDLW